MIKLFLIGILIFLIINNTSAQNLYSRQYLKSASQEETDLLYNNALKLKRAGTITTVSGLTIAGIGMAVGVNGLARTFIELEDHSNQVDSGGAIFTAGTIITLIGLPILTVGIWRKIRIDKIRRARSDCFYFELAPCSFRNLIVQNTQTSITLRLKF